MLKDSEWWSDFRMLWAFAGLCFALEDVGFALLASQLSRAYNELAEAGYTRVEIFMEILEGHDGTYGDGSDGHFGPNIAPIKVPARCQRFLDSILREVQARIAAGNGSESQA